MMDLRVGKETSACNEAYLGMNPAKREMNERRVKKSHLTKSAHCRSLAKTGDGVRLEQSPRETGILASYSRGPNRRPSR